MLVRLNCRVLIPTNEAEGLTIAEHFGRAPYLAVIDLSTDGSVIEKEVFQNEGEHRGGSGHTHINVLEYGPDVVIVRGMGPRGLRNFEEQNIAVVKALSDSVDNELRAFVRGDLKNIEEGCSDAHHK
ncbi:MAG: NifB/NifX family molybdenum-iron cluster-binding protein [Candidatus Thorarchaeota archaeon]